MGLQFLHTQLPTEGWLTCKMWIYVITNVRPAGRVSVRGKNLNVVILSDTINMVNVKLFMVVVLIVLYPCSYFKVTAVSRSFNRTFYVLIQLSLNFVRLLITKNKSWVYHCLIKKKINLLIFFIVTQVQGRSSAHFLVWKKKVGFFSDNIMTSFFKLWIIMTLLWVYIAILGWWPWLCFNVIG